MEKKIYWNIAGSIFLLGAIFASFLVYTNLNKGLIFNDEAFYLLHFREYKNIITVDSTNFFRIFQLFYTDNIYHFRLIIYFLLNSSTFLLFYFLAKYFKLKIHPVFIGFLGIAYNFLTWHASNIVLHQYLGNTILVNFCLFFLVLNLIYHKSFFILIAGFFLGILLFDGIPHIIVFLPIGLFLFFNFWKKANSKILYFCLGVFFAIGIYFTFVQNFSNFIDQFQYLKIYKSFHVKQHPKSYYLIWIAEVVGYIFIPGIIFQLILNQIKKKNKELWNNVFVGIILFALLYTIFFNAPYLNYFILLLLVFQFLQSDFNKEKKSLVATFFLLPFCLSFGSGVYFDTRSYAYLIYFILTLIIILTSLYSSKYTFIFVIYFLLNIYSFSDFTHEKGWKDFVFADQNESVLINGHALYLDKNRKKDIEDLRPFLQNQQKVIYSNNHLIGYLYILNALPPIPYYFTLMDYLKFILDKKGDSPDDYIYVESADFPFSPKEILPLQFVNHPENYQIVKSGKFTIYLPSNFQKK